MLPCLSVASSEIQRLHYDAVDMLVRIDDISALRQAPWIDTWRTMIGLVASNMRQGERHLAASRARCPRKNYRSALSGMKPTRQQSRLAVPLAHRQDARLDRTRACTGTGAFQVHVGGRAQRKA